MSDTELKELVASIAIAQVKTEENINRVSKQIEELKVAQKKTDEQLTKTDAQLTKTDIQLAKTDAQLAKTDAKLKKIGVLVGNISNNQGDVAEEFFYNSLIANPKLNNITYDFVDKNVTRYKQGLEDEYDIIMVNGKDIALIETKYKAHKNDVTKLVNKKYENFKKLYPEYEGYNHHLAIASFYINNDVKNEAFQNNVIVLQRKGKLIETITK